MCAVTRQVCRQALIKKELCCYAMLGGARKKRSPTLHFSLSAIRIRDLNISETSDCNWR